MLKNKGNATCSFDDTQKSKLGLYVYALRDPRDKKVFYIGQGQNDRLFEHFAEAEDAAKNHSKLTSKTMRIIEIWNEEEDVDYFIIAHKLSQEVANAVESAVIDALRESQNGDTINRVAGPNSSFLSQSNILSLAATPVNPKSAYPYVFIFPIHSALASGATTYSATRREWAVNTHLQTVGGIAVGLKNGICQDAFSIDSWGILTSGKQEFTGPSIMPHPDFDNTSWSNILNQSMGYWQRGNFLVVEFDGNGKFRFVRGSRDKTTWWSL